jgi:parvulin-like peptidyl-prolyl isomerase
MADQADQHDPIDDWLASKWSLLHIGPRRSLLLYATGALIGLGLAGFALFTAKGTSVKTFPPEDVALVNGRHILRSDFVAQIQVEAGVPFSQTTQAQRAKVLNEMIDEELLVQRGLEVDLAASDPDVRSAEVAGVNLQVDADVLAQQPTDADLHAYYEKHIAKYSSDGVMQVRDLVMPIGSATAADAIKSAQQAADEANKGASLESVMPKYQLKDSGAIDQGDNFDFAVRAKLGDEAYAALTKVMPGQVSQPVQRPDGIHVALLVKRIPSVKLDYAKAADNVWQDYKREKREQTEAANLRYLKGRADIELAPEFRR